MADFGEIPSHLRGALRTVFAGETGGWPALGGDDVAALVWHGVGPLVYSIARPPELREEALRAAAAEPLRLADLREVLGALGPRAIVIKGSALAYDLYAAPELRPRHDTDLLIARQSLEAVREIFANLGFTEQVTSGDEHGIRQLGFSRVDRFGIAHDYDVHWAIANSPLVADAIRFEEIEPLPLPRIGPQAFGLPDVEALLLACIHRVAHHHDEERLIWLADIALLRARMSDDDHRRFWTRAAERRVLAICRRSVEVAESWFGADPAHAGPAVEQDEPSAVLLDRDISYGAETLANLRALPWRQRLTRLRQLAFPPREFMQQMFETRSAAALPWLYVYRGARGVARLFKRAGGR